MKMKLNKACDLSSISVFPPQSRKPNAIPTGPQASQLRSQPLQQSFSQGLSSQHGIFSQNSLDDTLTLDQRFGSQERENSVKKNSCLVPINYAREESQIPSLRSSNSLIRKWNPASVQDNKSGQISEELEHRIGMIETSLNRFGMILDSVQGDIIQVNRGTKEVLLEMESIRQKLLLHDTSLQLMNRGREDIKASLEEGFKSVSDQLSKDIHQAKLQKILLPLSAFPEQIGASHLKLQTVLCNYFNKKIQAVACSLKNPAATVLPPKDNASCITPPRKPQSIRNPLAPQKVCAQENKAPRVEMRGCKSVKPGKATIKEKVSHDEHKRKGTSLIKQERECRVIIDSDEDVDGGFSCLLDEKKADIEEYLNEEKAKLETGRILRRARRQRRKDCNPIIIN
ncbi:putative recombination initiation defects 3 isoform X3 [Tripterygium wilfordii]|uniref:putative recombination initiation defects 3 isoform X3 n=1 Tax=Tripterygium wilfordii TaxID=458696 RepID=UPI0018F85491|nr:putative recombination initiation defects 3 isoform X3 [Tripterygium wilfordii]